LNAAVIEEPIAFDEEGVAPFARNSRKGGIDLAASAGIDNVDLQPEDARGVRHLFQCGLGGPSIGRIDQHGNASGIRHQRPIYLNLGCLTHL
jgi:hypothetical protein